MASLNMPLPSLYPPRQVQTLSSMTLTGYGTSTSSSMRHRQPCRCTALSRSCTRIQTSLPLAFSMLSHRKPGSTFLTRSQTPPSPTGSQSPVFWTSSSCPARLLKISSLNTLGSRVHPSCLLSGLLHIINAAGTTSAPRTYAKCRRRLTTTRCLLMFSGWISSTQKITSTSCGRTRPSLTPLR